MKTPNNGEKTHPLTAIALGVLCESARGPVLKRGVNPGIVDRLTREDLVELIELPSPWAAKGKKEAWHLRILEPGRARILETTKSRCRAQGCLAAAHRCGAPVEDLRQEIKDETPMFLLANVVS
jgi:hypothetical protein